MPDDDNGGRGKEEEGMNSTDTDIGVNRRVEANPWFAGDPQNDMDLENPRLGQSEMQITSYNLYNTFGHSCYYHYTACKSQND